MILGQIECQRLPVKPFHAPPSSDGLEFPKGRSRRYPNGSMPVENRYSQKAATHCEVGPRNITTLGTVPSASWRPGKSSKVEGRTRVNQELITSGRHQAHPARRAGATTSGYGESSRGSRQCHKESA